MAEEAKAQKGADPNAECRDSCIAASESKESREPDLVDDISNATTTTAHGEYPKDVAMAPPPDKGKGTINPSSKSDMKLPSRMGPTDGSGFFHQDIQELPETPIRQRSAASSIPGAHAVVTHRPFYTTSPSSDIIMTTTSNQAALSQSAAPESQPIEVLEAHVVSDHDDNDDNFYRNNDAESNNIQPNDLNDGLEQTDEVLEGTILTKNPAPKEEEETEEKKVVLWFLATCAIGALVLMLVFLLGPTTESADDNLSESMMTSSSTVVAAPLHYPPFIDGLPQMVTTAMEEDLTSSFRRANNWMWNDPHLDTYTPQRQLQRFFLAVMYYATNGDSWIRNDDWLSYDISECEWYSQSTYEEGISKYYEPHVCDDNKNQQGDEPNNNRVVINLSLASNNLTGSFPIWHAAFIPGLRILDLGHNHIQGLLPIIAATPDLEIFVISNNDFEGAARMSHIGGVFESLKVLRLDGTKIRGHNGGAMIYILPRDLEVYNFTGIPFDGIIWPQYGMLQQMEYLGLGHSDAVGTIATELGLVTALVGLDMSSLPHVYGTIPSEFGQLTNLQLLDLSDTPITGTIPEHLCTRVKEGLLSIPANCSLLHCCDE
ncbi:Leucine Rich Repeat [Seminavis robusta]|uniref:Leucine Rich Repeat n=1 Tax=Seminavis robusta TaxID=568900 RepID=A0A9N8HFW7_9STRA|nr:Leucine Rich Repeat [Seminavis robusta]|eukprot:Sro598_g172950.1 Leucine Rich Repeat (601) ;mRNA; f:6503-8305